MSNICKICGCTDDTPCETDEGPCSWAMTDLCTACVIVLPAGENCFKNVDLIVPKECRCCALLIDGEPWNDKNHFTCSEGRFDELDFPPGGHHWYAWSGISRPNKAVAKARKNCPHFRVAKRYLKEPE